MKAVEKTEEDGNEVYKTMVTKFVNYQATSLQASLTKRLRSLKEVFNTGWMLLRYHC